MRNSISAGFTAAALFALAPALPVVAADGQAPDAKICSNRENPPKDAVTKGGCLVLDRTKGNCVACHMVAGASAYGNIAPPLVAMAQRFPDKARLRAQVQDASRFNPKTVMPPFGRHEILTPQEIDNVVDFVFTL